MQSTNGFLSFLEAYTPSSHVHVESLIMGEITHFLKKNIHIVVSGLLQLNRTKREHFFRRPNMGSIVVPPHAILQVPESLLWCDICRQRSSTSLFALAHAAASHSPPPPASSPTATGSPPPTPPAVFASAATTARFSTHGDWAPSAASASAATVAASSPPMASPSRIACLHHPRALPPPDPCRVAPPNSFGSPRAAVGGTSVCLHLLQNS